MRSRTDLTFLPPITTSRFRVVNTITRPKRKPPRRQAIRQLRISLPGTFDRRSQNETPPRQVRGGVFKFKTRPRKRGRVRLSVIAYIQKFQPNCIVRKCKQLIFKCFVFKIILKYDVVIIILNQSSCCYIHSH